MLIGIKKLVFILRKCVLSPECLKPDMVFSSVCDIDPEDLKNKDIEVVLFDKDNTLTIPTEFNVTPEIKQKINEFKTVFNGKIAIISNLAGSSVDKERKVAEKFEKSSGIEVIRHVSQKPLFIPEILDKYGKITVDSVIIGDRLLTDVIFGNNMGFMTIYIKENIEGCPFRIRALRVFERWIVRLILGKKVKGLK